VLCCHIKCLYPFCDCTYVSTYGANATSSAPIGHLTGARVDAASQTRAAPAAEPRGSICPDVRIMNDLTIFVILAAHETNELRAAHTSGVETQCDQLFPDVR
jgi:hypothetical protein